MNVFCAAAVNCAHTPPFVHRSTFSHVLVHGELEVLAAAHHSDRVPLVVVELLSGVDHLRALAWRLRRVSRGKGGGESQRKPSLCCFDSFGIFSHWLLKSDNGFEKCLNIWRVARRLHIPFVAVFAVCCVICQGAFAIVIFFGLFFYFSNKDLAWVSQQRKNVKHMFASDMFAVTHTTTHQEHIL